MTTNWERVAVLAFGDFSAAALTKTVAIHVPRENIELEDVVVERITDFSGGSITTCTVQVGVAGSTAKYFAATDVFTGAKATAARTVGSATASVKPRDIVPGGTTINILMTGSHNLDTLTAGKLAVFIKKGAAPRFT